MEYEIDPYQLLYGLDVELETECVNYMATKDRAYILDYVTGEILDDFALH